MLRFMQTYAKSNFWPRPHFGAFSRDLRCRINFSEELESPSGFVGCIVKLCALLNSRKSLEMRPPQR